MHTNTSRKKRITKIAKPLARRLPHFIAIPVIGVIMVAGIAALQFSRASSVAIVLEPEQGTSTSGAVSVNDPTASGGKAVQFKASASLYNPAQSWDYQTGDFSQWSNIQAATDNQPSIVADTIRPDFAKSAKFVARQGKNPSWNTDPTVDRTELSSSIADTGTPTEGLEQWYWWSSHFGSDVTVDPGNWMSYTQWHQTANTGNPNIAFLVTAGSTPRIKLSMLGGNPDTSLRWSGSWDGGAIERNSWTDHLVYIKWSSDPAKGRIGLWVNGVEKIAPSTPVANLYSSGGQTAGPQSAYFKQGIYRGTTNRTHTIHYTGTVRGHTRDSVLGYKTTVDTPPSTTYSPTQEWNYTGSYPWNFSHVHGPQPVIVASPHPKFTKAAKYTVNGSTRASFDPSSVRRSEMVQGNFDKIGTPRNGLTQWWAGTFWLSSNFVAPTHHPSTGGWLFPLQFHAEGNAKPLVFNFPSDVSPARFQLSTQSHKYDLGTIPTNIQQTIDGTQSNRVDWKMKVLWHESSSTGRISFWVNGVQKVNNQPAQTLIPGENNYLKQGLYGNSWTSGTTPEPQQIIFDTGLRYGPTEASISL